MTILHWNFLSIFIYAYFLLGKYNTNKNKKIFIGLVTLQFVLINGLRHFSVGIDTIVYHWGFRDAVESSHLLELFSMNRYEPGYNLLAWVVGLFTTNYAIFFIVLALLIFIPLAFFIYRNSENYFLSYFMFVVLRLYDFSMNGLRQAIAMSIVLFAFEFAMEKKLWKFLTCVIIATLFHYSAIIILPIYILANIKLKKQHLYIVGIAYVIFYFSRGYINNLAYKLYYINTDPSFVNHYEITGIGLMGVFIIAVVILGALLHNPLSAKTSRKMRTLFYIMVIAIFVHTLSTGSYLFKRLNFYYLQYMIIFIPEIFITTKSYAFSINKKIEKLLEPITIKLNSYYKRIPKSVSFEQVLKIAKILMVIVLSFYYLSIINNDYYGLLPYGMFFQDFEFELNRWD